METLTCWYDVFYLTCSLLARFFVFQIKFFQDPVCGSAHCALAPYWCKKLGKCDFVALAVLAFSSKLPHPPSMHQKAETT